MICAIVDIGSNTIRLSTYQYEEGKVKKLFHKKITAGLASYVTEEVMSQDGIDRCCQVLLDFKETLELLPIEKVAIFATAALRNIQNSQEAIREIMGQTGFHIDLLSGKEEAEYGYFGIRYIHQIPKGIVIDIGGGSTEVTLFSQENIEYADSFPIGSLNMYKKNVSKILPSKKEKQEIQNQVREVIGREIFKKIRQCGEIVVVGGSARAVLQIANLLFHLPADNETLSIEQLEELSQLFGKKENRTTALLLQVCPDRIHTFIPGLLILTTIVKESKEEKIQVSSLGVREGYLYKKILEIV